MLPLTVIFPRTNMLPLTKYSMTVDARFATFSAAAVAEERFLLVERRLRDIVVRALRSSALLDFMVGLEKLLEGFAEVKRGYGSGGMCFQALVLALFTRKSATLVGGRTDRWASQPLEQPRDETTPLQKSSEGVDRTVPVAKQTKRACSVNKPGKSLTGCRNPTNERGVCVCVCVCFFVWANPAFGRRRSVAL